MLRMVGVTKTFGSLVAVDGVDLVLTRRAITALVGENGAGKTTLMRVLTGELRPDAGSVSIDGVPIRLASTAEALDNGITMVRQHFALAPSATVAENVVLGREPGRRWWTAPQAFRDRTDELARRSGLHVDAAATTGPLSVGLLQRVEILKALHREAQYLALDEPTAVLTPQEASDLFVQLRGIAEAGAAVVFISHKLPEVLAIADHIIVMRKGRIVGEVARPDATPELLAGLMTGRATFLPHERRRLDGSAPKVLEVQDVSTPAQADGYRLRDVSLDILQGEIVGVAAIEGNGQSTLMAAIAGVEPISAGKISIAGTDVTGLTIERRRALGVGYVPEDRHAQAMPPEASLYEALSPLPRSGQTRRFTSWFRRYRSPASERRVVEMLTDFDVRYQSIDGACRDLSGGNQQKAVLAREVSRAPSLLLLGQPTRGVDVGAVHDLHGKILSARERGAAVLLVSADLDEVVQLSDRIIVMYEGAIVASVDAAAADRETLGLWMTGQVPA